VSSRARLIGAFLRKRTELIRIFAARLRSPAAAEDLVQDIYLRLASMDADFVPENEDGYLFRIGANLMLDRLKVERRAANREHQWQASYGEIADGEQVADEPGPERQVIGRQRLEQILAIIDTLPPKAGQAFRLHKISGLTHQEVADKMGISRSAVEKHISAALKQLLLRLS
jgi:RNA polymerase sigma-70 factor (ECF subfamily)